MPIGAEETVASATPLPEGVQAMALNPMVIDTNTDESELAPLSPRVEVAEKLPDKALDQPDSGVGDGGVGIDVSVEVSKEHDGGDNLPWYRRTRNLIALTLGVLAMLLVFGVIFGVVIWPEIEGPTEQEVFFSAPALVYDKDDPTELPGQYLVVFEKDATQAEVFEILDELLNSGLANRHLPTNYHMAMLGFACNLTATQVKALRLRPFIAYLEVQKVMVEEAVQNNAPWNLDQVDGNPSDGAFTYGATGQGVHVYVIDTGVNGNHDDFAGRMSSRNNNQVRRRRNNNPTWGDCDGHGTHVAGTAVGTMYGAAKGATLHAVRVLGCSGSGSTADIIRGIDWVIQNKEQPAVIVMSLGGSPSTSLDNAVSNAVNEGIFVAVAAGNEAQDACNVSPAGGPDAFTVGATTTSNAKAGFSNYGDCVDMFAPGVGIPSASHTDNSASKTFSGTSMAAPLVAGAAALFLEGNPTSTPAQVQAALVAAAKSLVTGSQTPHNRLLQTSTFTATPTPTPTPTPTLPTPTPSPTPSPLPTPTPTPVQPATRRRRSQTPTPQPEWQVTEGTLSRREYKSGEEMKLTERSYIYCKMKGPRRRTVDFDLKLMKKKVRNGKTQWRVVAVSMSWGSNERIRVRRNSGTYMCTAVSYKGSGNFKMKYLHTVNKRRL